ncbi:HTTM domain-containing protein [Pseudonocardia sp.]|uniref:HTTM domain-containing protein n=1 Tax=Pseudonocardia sp. TaxID=60912 RepID=UPI003D14254E
MDLVVDRRRDIAGVGGTAFAGVAYAVFAVAFAIGTLVHEFQSTALWWVAIPIAVVAFAVILRPTKPALLVTLLALLGLECFTALPDPINHQILMGILGLTLGPWWVWTRLRHPEIANDPAAMWVRVTPYLRVSFIVLWASAAIAKLNTGFTDVAATCSVWILQSIPFVTVPTPLHPAVIYGTMALELSIPTMLLFHRTRPFAIVLAFGFHLVSCFAGHSSFSGFAWSMYILFLPPAVLARGVVLARRSVPERMRGAVAAAIARPVLTVAVLAAVWVLGRYVAIGMLPASLRGGARHWGALLLCVTFMLASGWLLLRLRPHWLPAPRAPRASLRVTSVVMILGIGLVAFTAAMPYVGLKTRAAFTMFSNVRTEPGHWNHLLIPESVRVFDWQDGEVHFISTDDPVLDRKIKALDAEDTVLLGARRIADEFPDATVHYTLDGVERVAAPVSSDPVLGLPLSPAQEYFGALRPFVEGGTCQH